MMKKFCAAIVAAAMIQATASAAVVFTEDFSYPDGDLATNPGWVKHSGSDGAPTIDVVGGAAVVTHGSGSRDDLNYAFAEITSGVASYQFDMVVSGSGPFAGTDSEYFAHFGTTTDGGLNVSGFVGRLDVVAPSGGGDYSLGIATFSGSPDATTAQSFSFGETVSVTVTYDTDSDVSTLMVGGETISGATGTQPGSVNTFALRQSSSSINESITIDNLVVSQVSAIPEPSSLASLGLLACGTVMAGRRRRK